MKEDDEELADKCEEIVRHEGRASVSLFQRRLRLGFNRACNVMDILEKRGIVAPLGENQKLFLTRKLLISEREHTNELKISRAQDALAIGLWRNQKDEIANGAVFYDLEELKHWLVDVIIWFRQPTIEQLNFANTRAAHKADKVEHVFVNSNPRWDQDRQEKIVSAIYAFARAQQNRKLDCKSRPFNGDASTEVSVNLDAVGEALEEIMGTFGYDVCPID
jgi:hypothetical protein